MHDGIMAWNCENPGAVRQHDVFSLASDFEAGLFKRPNGIEMIDAR
jgi:hypothetical protein